MQRKPRSVILDLDESIVHCAEVRPQDAKGMPCFQWRSDTVILRPHFKDFLGFLLSIFDHIYVFTAARTDYAECVVDQVLGGKRFVRHVWTRDDCKIESANIPGKDAWYVYKPLQGKYTPCGHHLDSPYTIMIDDRQEISHKNLHAHSSLGSHYVISPFFGDPEDRGLLDCMEYIKNWVSRLPVP